MNSKNSKTNQANDAQTPKATKQQKRYYIEYPRNFGNEYTIYVVDTPEMVTWAEEQERQSDGINQTFERITRTEALSKAHSTGYSQGQLYVGLTEWKMVIRGPLTMAERLEISARSLEKYIREAEEFAAEEAEQQREFEAYVEAEYERGLTRG